MPRDPAKRFWDDRLREAAAAAGAIDVERIVGEGTQVCLVRTRRRD